MTTKPAPYPADTKAKGWRFEVDMEAVKSSDTWLRAKTGAVRGALMLLWAESWGQTPCGSLPNDDELVALLIDMPDSTFARHRAVLMRGWWLADDGRLYHDTITARVAVMLDKRANDAARAANRRAKLLDSQAGNGELTQESRVTNTGLQGEFDTKHQAPSTKHQGEGRARAPRKPAADAALILTLADLTSEGVDKAHGAAWLAVRAKHKAPLTQVAWDGTKAHAAKAGITPGQAVHICAIKSWRGFDSAWSWQGVIDTGHATPRPSAQGEETPEQKAARREEGRRLAFGKKPAGDVIDA
jgi:hypothetical protein